MFSQQQRLWQGQQNNQSDTRSERPSIWENSSPTKSADDSGNVSTSPSTPPKEGGAIAGMGEKFNVNSATGTASLLSIPITASPGRDLSPNLELT